MKTHLALVAMLLSAGPLLAQHKHDDNPFAQHLFTPELVMSKMAEIGLKDAQREQVRAAVQKAQSAFTDLQFKMAPEGEKLHKLLQADVVDEGRVMAQLDQILQIEREIKRTHVALLVRIHNLLTPEQRERLRKAHGS